MTTTATTTPIHCSRCHASATGIVTADAEAGLCTVGYVGPLGQHHADHDWTGRVVDGTARTIRGEECDCSTPSVLTDEQVLTALEMLDNIPSMPYLDIVTKVGTYRVRRDGSVTYVPGGIAVVIETA